MSAVTNSIPIPLGERVRYHLQRIRIRSVHDLKIYDSKSSIPGSVGAWLKAIRFTLVLRANLFRKLFDSSHIQEGVHSSGKIGAYVKTRMYLVLP
jgi:hypothetical protein